MATQNGPIFCLPSAYALDQVGVAEPGDRLEFYLTGSDTPSPVYLIGDLSSPTNNVEALDDGTWPELFMDPSVTYRVVWTGPDDGINPPEERKTWDPVKFGWPVEDVVVADIAFERLETGVTADQIVGMYTAIRPQRIPGNFDGTSDADIGVQAWGNLITPPAADLAFFCYLNNVTSVGFMSIATDGTITFFTSGGNPFEMDAGEFITWRADITDAAVAFVSWTIPAENI